MLVVINKSNSISKVKNWVLSDIEKLMIRKLYFLSIKYCLRCGFLLIYNKNKGY